MSEELIMECLAALGAVAIVAIVICVGWGVLALVDKVKELMNDIYIIKIRSRWILDNNAQLSAEVAKTRKSIEADIQGVKMHVVDTVDRVAELGKDIKDIQRKQNTKSNKKGKNK
jgi:uncharacterized protein YoxC